MRRRLVELAPWIALAAAWAVFLWSRHGGLYAASDDSYIYLGYVKRALTPPRELFSYNPGEHSAGVTGMLYYYVLVAVCGAVHGVLGAQRVESDLLLGAYLANAGLLLLAAWLYLRCWQRLTADGGRLGALSLAFAFLLFCAQPKWLWAVFAGLEGPLAGVLALCVLDRLLARAPAWQTSVAASLLVATRPETMLVAFLLPLLAALADPRRPLALRAALAYGTAGLTLVSLVIPCWALTGRFFPSSLGTRVHLAALLEPAGVARYLERVIAQPAYWQSEWWTLGVGLLLVGVLLGVRAGRWTIARLAGFLLAFLLLRVGLGLAAFSLEDRYVSYLWPLYALGLGACGAEALRCMPAPLALSRSREAALAALLVFAMAALPVREFALRSSRHVANMNAIVVEPSRWMRAQLPADARVFMEPAGEIRVFTDFYLVDAIGLTTTHARSQAGNLPDFLHDHRVGWVFDRPAPVGDLLLERRAARDLARFGRGLPWGDVHLYEVDLSAAITLVRVVGHPKVAGRASAVFDNNAAASWSALVGGGSGFAAGEWPQTLAAEFAEPALVTALTVSLSGVRSRLDASRAAAAHGFEAEHDGGWKRIATEAPRIESIDRGVARATLPLVEPMRLEGIRIVRDTASRAQINELSLSREGRPYVWLWADALRAD